MALEESRSWGDLPGNVGRSFIFCRVFAVIFHKRRKWRIFRIQSAPWRGGEEENSERRHDQDAADEVSLGAVFFHHFLERFHQLQVNLGEVFWVQRNQEVLSFTLNLLGPDSGPGYWYNFLSSRKVRLWRGCMVGNFFFLLTKIEDEFSKDFLFFWKINSYRKGGPSFRKIGLCFVENF